MLKESIGYKDYLIDQILSSEISLHKPNLLLINKKYYFQFPNSLEGSELEILQEYSEQIDVIDEGKYARIVKLEDLYNLCQYLKVNKQLLAALIFQHLGFQEITLDFISFNDKQECLNEITKNIEFISLEGDQFLKNQLQNINIPQNVQQDIREAYSEYLLINPQIGKVGVIPFDMQRYKRMILQNEASKITKEENERFIEWFELMKYNVIQPDSNFNPEHDLQQEEKYISERVQNFLDENINSLRKQETCLCDYCEEAEISNPIDKIEKQHIKQEQNQKLLQTNLNSNSSNTSSQTHNKKQKSQSLIDGEQNPENMNDEEQNVEIQQNEKQNFDMHLDEEENLEMFNKKELNNIEMSQAEEQLPEIFKYEEQDFEMSEDREERCQSLNSLINGFYANYNFLKEEQQEEDQEIKINRLISKMKILREPRIQEIDKNKIRIQMCKLYQQKILEQIPPKVIHSEDFQREKKVYVEMRQIDNGKVRLVTRDQDIDQINYLFYKNYKTKKYQEIDKQNIIESLKKQLKNPLDDFAYVYFNIKQFSLNIDYDIIEKQFNLPDLAKYLRERQIWYKDSVNKKEQLLQIKKGIFIGEYFHNFIEYKMSCFLVDRIQQIFSDYSDIVFNQGVEIQSLSGDILVKINLNIHSINQIKKQIQNFIKVTSNYVNDIGLELDQKKTQVLILESGIQTTYQVNEEYQFMSCDSFNLLGLNLINTFKEIKLDKSIIDFVNKLLYQSNQTKDPSLIFEKLSPIEQSCSLSFINEFYEKSKEGSFKQLTQILSRLMERLKCPYSLFKDL